MIHAFTFIFFPVFRILIFRIILIHTAFYIFEISICFYCFESLFLKTVSVYFFYLSVIPQADSALCPECCEARLFIRIHCCSRLLYKLRNKKLLLANRMQLKCVLCIDLFVLGSMKNLCSKIVFFSGRPEENV